MVEGDCWSPPATGTVKVAAKLIWMRLQSFRIVDGHISYHPTSISMERVSCDANRCTTSFALKKAVSASVFFKREGNRKANSFSRTHIMNQLIDALWDSMTKLVEDKQAAPIALLHV